MMYAVQNFESDSVRDRPLCLSSLSQQIKKHENTFGCYKLCQETLDKLQEVDDLLKHDICPADPAWAVIKPTKVKKNEIEDEEPISQVKVPENTEDCEYQTVVSSTQFFFSQKERICDSPDSVEPVDSRWSDVAESLYESLENTNETPALVYLKNLSDTQVSNVVKYLSNKLSSKGIYNLCQGIRALGADQGGIYVRIICRHLLLQRIINPIEPSRLIGSSIHDLAKEFPEDIQDFLYTPILNAELRDTTVVSAMINSFDPQRKNDLITNFLNAVHTLQEWHLVVLCQLINARLADSTKDKLLNLLADKASPYSHDKNYGKFVLSFVKLNTPFTEEQKGLLNEIVAANETIFKRVMENLLKNMYLYGDVWHIS